MSASDWAAWWGAGVATFLALLEIFDRVRKGARLQVRVVPGMVLAGPLGVGSEEFVFLSATNVGDTPTKITHVVGHVYRDEINAKNGVHERQFVIAPGLKLNYPAVLSPGEDWKGYVPQEELASLLALGKPLSLGVLHTMSKKPAMAPLMPH
jgi:hypothetical protein